MDPGFYVAKLSSKQIKAVFIIGKIGGLGIALASAMVDEISYEQKNGKNLLTLFKIL